MKRSTRLFVFGAALSLSMSAKAVITTTLIDFDTFNNQPLAAGTTIDTLYQPTLHVTFENFRDFGDPTDPSDDEPYTPATVDSPLAYNGYAPATAPNALNAKLSSVWVSFDQQFYPAGITSLSISLDNDPFGDPLPVTFYYVNGSSNVQLVDQAVPGAVYTFPLNGATKVLLPSGAFYDNLTFTGNLVPEPGTIASLLVGAASLLGFTRRNKR